MLHLHCDMCTKKHICSYLFSPTTRSNYRLLLPLELLMKPVGGSFGSQENQNMVYYKICFITNP